VGTTIEAFKNGVSLGTVVDATIPSGAGGGGKYGTTVTMDTLTVDNLVPPAPIVQPAGPLAVQQRMAA
jgi:hypothetical protein